MKNNPYASVVDEVPNDEEDLTTYASKINEEDDDMSISYQEKNNTVGYQETLKYMSKISTNTFRQHVDQYMKLLMLHFSKKRTFFHKLFQIDVK